MLRQFRPAFGHPTSMALNLIAPLHPREPKQAQTLLAVGEVGLKEWPELFLPRRLPAAKSARPQALGGGTFTNRQGELMEGPFKCLKACLANIEEGDGAPIAGNAQIHLRGRSKCNCAVGWGLLCCPTSGQTSRSCSCTSKDTMCDVTANFHDAPVYIYTHVTATACFNR